MTDQETNITPTYGSAKEERPVVHGSAVTRNARKVLGPPDLENDVTSVIDIKMDAYRAHRSQSEAMLRRMETQMAADPQFREKTEQNMRREVFWVCPVEA